MPPERSPYHSATSTTRSVVRGAGAAGSASAWALRGTPRPRGRALAEGAVVAVGQARQRARPGALSHRLERALGQALALQRGGGELDDRVGKRARLGRAQEPGDAVLDDR